MTPFEPQTEIGRRIIGCPDAATACTAIMPRGSIARPNCGHQREARCEIVHSDGELVALGSKDSGRRDPTIEEKARFFAELKYHVGEKGHKPGWAADNHREKFGVWPNDPRIRYAEPRPPSLKTRNWIRSRQIAHAKARARG